MSELEIKRMNIILECLVAMKSINSATAAELIETQVKTAARLLLKGEKAGILKSSGRTNNKMYYRNNKN